MSSFQKITLVGNVGSVDFFEGEHPVARFSVATTETWKDKKNNKQEKTTWHKCVAFGRLSDVIADYVGVGTKVLVEGTLDQNKYTDKDGIERVTFNIKVREFKILSSPSDREAEQAEETEEGYEG